MLRQQDEKEHIVQAPAEEEYTFSVEEIIAEFRDMPQEGQNFAPGGSCDPHEAQKPPWFTFAPHWRQNLDPAGMAVPHCAQAVPAAGAAMGATAVGMPPIGPGCWCACTCAGCWPYPCWR